MVEWEILMGMEKFNRKQMKHNKTKEDRICICIICPCISVIICIKNEHKCCKGAED